MIWQLIISMTGSYVSNDYMVCRDHNIMQMLTFSVLSRTELDGYGPVGYQGYSNGMHMDNMQIDQEMPEDYGSGMAYNSMARPYHDY